jgi:hypothetical protein
MDISLQVRNLRAKLMNQLVLNKGMHFLLAKLLFFGKNREKEKENSVVGIMFFAKKIKVLPKIIFPLINRE